MDENLLENLTLPHRLALSYAPARSRASVLALLMLESRLAAILRQRGEAIIAQLKLAWWRDRFAEDRASWPAGEPLLELLRGWPGDTAALGRLVDGWEELLGEQLDRAAIEGFVSARAGVWAALGSAGDDESAARQFALADLALHLEPGPERDAVASLLAEARTSSQPACSRNLRPLAVLRALALRAFDRGSDDLLDGPAALLLALRVGIIGR